MWWLKPTLSGNGAASAAPAAPAPSAKVQKSVERNVIAVAQSLNAPARRLFGGIPRAGRICLSSCDREVAG